MNKFTKLQEALGWTNAETAENLCVHIRTVYKYRSGELKAPKDVTKLFKKLLEERKEVEVDKNYGLVAIVIGLVVILLLLA